MVEFNTGADASLDAAVKSRLLANSDTNTLTDAQVTKLDGVADGATVNDTDANLRDRATHTGTQDVGSVTGLASVAVSGDYVDLLNTPTLGSAASTDATAYATAAQGDLADSAVQEGDTLGGGFSATVDDDGTITTGIYTPAVTGGNYKGIINGGAFTITPPTITIGTATDISVIITNSVSAGVITVSGFTSVTGADFTTTNGDSFVVHVKAFNIGGVGYSILNVVALQ